MFSRADAVFIFKLSSPVRDWMSRNWVIKVESDLIKYITSTISVPQSENRGSTLEDCINESNE